MEGIMNIANFVTPIPQPQAPPPHVHAILVAVTAVCIAVTLGSALHLIFFRVLSRFRRKQDIKASPLLHAVATRLRRPAFVITLLTALFFALPFLDFDAHFQAVAGKCLSIAWFLAFGWVMVSGVYLIEDVMLLRYTMETADDLRARRVRTQTQLLRRMAIILLIIIDAGLILSLFKDSAIWHYGAGLLASAGLASLVLATAAKSSASNLLAGIQIALTEPIRLEDVVIIENEWGKIEEITTTYVVVRTWDLRRLIVPLSFFIDKSFQNWTREHTELLGTAFLYVDYSVPVDTLRKEFFRLLEGEPQWDGKVKALQVTNISEQTVEIRCLLSASNASDQFDLRCIIREGMLRFIQDNFPDAFPRTRFSPTGGEIKVGTASNGGNGMGNGAGMLEPQHASAR